MAHHPSSANESSDGPPSPLTERESISPTSTLDERGSVAPLVPGTGRSQGGPGNTNSEGRWNTRPWRTVGVRQGACDGNGRRHHRCRYPGSRRWAGSDAGRNNNPPPVTAPARPSMPAPERSAAAKIRVMFRDYQTIKNPQQKQALRKTMLALCKIVLPERDDPRRGRYIDADTALVADIQAVLDRDKGQAKAQARYVTDAYAGGPTDQPERMHQARRS